MNGIIDPIFEFPGSSAAKYTAKPHGEVAQNSKRI